MTLALPAPAPRAVRTVRLATLGSTASATATTVREYASRGSVSTAGTATVGGADMPRFAAGAIGSGPPGERVPDVLLEGDPSGVVAQARRARRARRTAARRAWSAGTASHIARCPCDQENSRKCSGSRNAGLDGAVRRPDVGQAGGREQVRHAVVGPERSAPAARARVEHRGRQVRVEQRVDGPPPLVLRAERGHAEPPAGPEQLGPGAQRGARGRAGRRAPGRTRRRRTTTPGGRARGRRRPGPRPAAGRPGRAR